jgi:hypothetical protein
LDFEGAMSKKLKPEAIKVMITKATAQKIAPIVERLDSAEEMLKDMQAMLKAIQARLNVAPDNPAFEAMNSGLAADPLTQPERHPLARHVNPLVFPDTRRAIERVFAKRARTDSDTVESVLREAQGG